MWERPHPEVRPGPTSWCPWMGLWRRAGGVKWFRGQWGYCGVRSGEHPPPFTGKGPKKQPILPCPLGWLLSPLLLLFHLCPLTGSLPARQPRSDLVSGYMWAQKSGDLTLSPAPQVLGPVGGCCFRLTQVPLSHTTWGATSAVLLAAPSPPSASSLNDRRRN